MENFDAEQPMEDLQEQTPKKEPKNPLYDCYSLLHDLVYILAAITIVFVFFVRLVGVDDHTGHFVYQQDVLILIDNVQLWLKQLQKRIFRRRLVKELIIDI